MDLRKKIKNFFTLTRKANAGFTLVELIVVIAVLAILGGVAVPAYSGYVKKAERSADEALLNEINTAFASACMANGESNYGRTDVANIIPTNGVVGDGALNTSNDNIDASFDGFFEGGTFKTMGPIYYVAEIGGFLSQSEEMQELAKILAEKFPEAIENLKASGFNAIGYDKLAGQIENASDLLASVAASDATSGFGQLLMSEGNLATLLDYLGDEDPENPVAYNALLTQKVAQLKADPKYADCEDYEALANAQILANTSVLTAAQNKSAINDDFINSLKNGNAVDALKASTDGGNATSDTVAQAAYAYAMYTSYMKYSNQTIPDKVDVLGVYEVLGTDGFKAYMENDYKADHEGYMGALDLIAGSAENVGENTANDILLNGFNNPELVSLLQSLAK